MTLKQRVIAIVLEAIRNLGTGHRLADYLGVTPQAVTNWKSGRDAPTARHLIRMQDLVKKAACVLFAIAATTQTTDSGATGQNWEHGTDSRALNTLHIVQRLKALFRDLTQAAGLAVRLPAR